MEFTSPITLDDITSERILQMKGILAEPGKAPVIASLPDSLLNRKYRGRQLYGPILCYGWKGNNIQPMNKDVQTEMLDRLKGTEVRV